MHRRVVGRAGERFVQPLNSATNIWYVFNNINKLRPRQSCMCDEYDWNLVVCRHNKNNQFLEKLTTTNCNEAAQINRIIIILIDWWKCIRTEQTQFPLSLCVCLVWEPMKLWISAWKTSAQSMRLLAVRVCVCSYSMRWHGAVPAYNQVNKRFNDMKMYPYALSDIPEAMLIGCNWRCIKIHCSRRFTFSITTWCDWKEWDYEQVNVLHVECLASE